MKVNGAILRTLCGDEIVELVRVVNEIEKLPAIDFGIPDELPIAFADHALGVLEVADYEWIDFRFLAAYSRHEGLAIDFGRRYAGEFADRRKQIAEITLCGALLIGRNVRPRHD